MQLTLVLPPTVPALTLPATAAQLPTTASTRPPSDVEDSDVDGASGAGVPAGTSLRPIAPADSDAVGELYHRCLPAEERTTVQNAIADINLAFEGEYGRLIGPASLLAARPGSTDQGTELHASSGGGDVEELLGAVLTVDSPPWPDVEDLVFLIELFVAPEARRQGIARALLTQAIGAVRREHPGRVIGLRVESGNSGAVHLYRSLGFVERR